MGKTNSRQSNAEDTAVGEKAVQQAERRVAEEGLKFALRDASVHNRRQRFKR